MQGGENRASLFEGLHIFLFAVGSAILPTFPQNPNPFESQSTNDRVKVFTFIGVVIDIVAGPLRFGYRESGEFMESLAVEFGTSDPEINGSGFAATLGYRCNPREAMNILCGLVTGTIGAKES